MKYYRILLMKGKATDFIATRDKTLVMIRSLPQSLTSCIKLNNAIIYPESQTIRVLLQLIFLKKYSCSFVGNRDLCGKQINMACKDDGGGPGTNPQSPTSGK